MSEELLPLCEIKSWKRKNLGITIHQKLLFFVFVKLVTEPKREFTFRGVASFECVDELEMEKYLCSDPSKIASFDFGKRVTVV